MEGGDTKTGCMSVCLFVYFGHSSLIDVLSTREKNFPENSVVVLFAFNYFLIGSPSQPPKRHRSTDLDIANISGT